MAHVSSDSTNIRTHTLTHTYTTHTSSGTLAREVCRQCTRFVKAGKESQQFAQGQKDEAMYWTRAAIDFKAYLHAWLGMKRFISLNYQ